MGVLFRNVSVFDGENEKVAVGKSVLIEENKIAKIADSIPVSAGTEVIEAGDGKVIMPGLIDSHWHSMFNFFPVSKITSADLGYLSIAAALAARDVLGRGFTSVRDAGGNCFGVMKAVNEGLVEGPRIFPCGGYLSQTSGHGDFRGPNDVPENPGTPLDYMQRVGHTLIADGVPDVLKRTREVLRTGATQIKAMAGGGVTSLYDPIDVVEYTLEELKAIVDVAKSWNTYVCVHVNTDAGIRQALEAGVLSIEHGFFLTEDTAKLMADKGAWWSMQPMMNDEDALKFESPISTAKYEKCVEGLEQAVQFAKKHKVKTAFGTDSLFTPEASRKQGKMLSKLKRWYTPFEALKMATYDSAQLLQMCGPRNPYPGDIGVVKEGALADLILVDGNPLENLDLVADPERNFVVIMKDGKVHRNKLGAAAPKEIRKAA